MAEVTAGECDYCKIAITFKTPLCGSKRVNAWFRQLSCPTMFPEENNEQSTVGTGPPSLSFGEKPLPRWVLVPVAIVLGLFRLLCGLALLSLLLMRYRYSPSRFLLVAVALLLLLACGWILTKCFRLITGRKQRGELLSPNTLRVVAAF